MIYPGSDLKYKILSTIPGFSMDDDPFTVEVRDRYRRRIAFLTKEDCFRDDGGEWYFVLESVRSGIYSVIFSAYIPDDDYNSTYRKYTDMQPLCAVGFCDNHMPPMPDCDKDRHLVAYERIQASDLDQAPYLTDKSGAMMVTADELRISFAVAQGRRVQLDNLSGSDFKELIEGRKEGGRIDTIPEMIESLGGLGDDTEYSTMTNADVDDMMERILNTDSGEEDE